MSSQTNPKRRCCFCGTELYGRADKKFCDDNCRNNYHYRIRLNDNDDLVIKMVNSTLLKCRETLKTLCLGQKKIVDKKLLDDRHFDYELMTNVYKTKGESEYRVVYDYAYKILNDDEVLILKFVK